MMQAWRDSFDRDATQAVTDLFSGRAGIGASFRRDVPEILLHEFPDRPEFAADREKLDVALLDWLEFMRRDYARQVKRLDYGVYAQRLCDALRALQLLKLPCSIEHIRDGHSAWLQWLAPLRLAPERDPALESWRLLSLKQPLESSPAPWLQLAADPRPEYLAVGLLGLERQPLPDIKHNHTLMLAALLHHCAGIGTPEQGAADFNRRYASLRGRYPRGPEHWQSLFDTAIDSVKAHPSIPRLNRLIAQLDQSHPRRARHTRRSARSLPTRAEKDDLGSAIRDPKLSTAKVESRFVDILGRYLYNARHTGDGFFFVGTLCDHGNLLLKRKDIAMNVIVLVGDWIEEALRWEPRNPYVWMFWADWLAWQGREFQQEWVLREAVRLFPENEPSRVELARLLIHGGYDNFGEAERLLREAAVRRPDNSHSRVELARLLVHQGKEQWPEAEHLLREVAACHPENVHSRVELSRLLVRQGEEQWPEAEHLLRAVVGRSPDEHSRVELARLLILKGEEHWPEAEHWLREAAYLNPNQVYCRIELARLLIRQGIEHWGEAEQLLSAAAHQDPDDEHSRIELAQLLGAAGRFAEAQSTLRSLLSRNPSLVLAETLLKQLGDGQPSPTLLQDGDDFAKSDETASAGLQGGRGAPFGVAIVSSDSQATNPNSLPTPGEVRAGETHPSTELKDESGFRSETAGLGLRTDGATSNGAGSNSSVPYAAKPSPLLSPIETLLDSLQRRAETQALFATARENGQQIARNALRTAASSGDAFAGLYAEWLGESIDIPPPPHAWGWRVAHCYRSGFEADWQALDTSFPEFFDLNQYLRWLATSSANGVALTARLARRFEKRFDEGEESPAWLFARRTWQTLNSQVDTQDAPAKDDIAFALIQAEAVPALLI